MNDNNNPDAVAPAEPSPWKGLDPRGAAIPAGLALELMEAIPAGWTEFHCWQAFISHPDPLVRATYVLNNEISRQIQAWILINDKASIVLGALGANPRTEEFVLVMLAINLDADVRLCVVENKSCPTDVLKNLTLDPDRFVALAAEHRLSIRREEEKEAAMSLVTPAAEGTASTGRNAQMAEAGNVGSLDPVQETQVFPEDQ